MSIFNILDQRRKNEYNTNIDVVYEIFASNWTDFGLPESTQDYTEWQHRTSVYEATCIAARLEGLVTMYFYDPGWVIENYGFIVTIHAKLKRDVMIPHEMDTKFLRTF
jgi:hypothetical protein